MVGPGLSASTRPHVGCHRARARRAVLLFALLSCAPTGPRIGAQATDPFAVAVVREDGILVPFARFDGSSWSQIWQSPGQRRTVPSSLAELPAAWFPPDGRVPTPWYLWPVVDVVPRSPFEARTAQTLVVERPVAFDAHCLSAIGLATDYRGSGDPQPSTTAHPKLKAGLASTSAALRVERATEVDAASEMGRWAGTEATAAFHRAEGAHLETYDRSERRPVASLAERRAVPVRWTKILRLGAAQAPVRTYYLEGEVEYASSTVAAGHVWLLIAPNRQTTDAEVVFTDADRKQVRSRASLGVIRMGDRRFWAFESQLWEHESYELFELPGEMRRPVALLDVSAGGC